VATQLTLVINDRRMTTALVYEKRTTDAHFINKRDLASQIYLKRPTIPPIFFADRLRSLSQDYAAASK
jgi:hypothetical protein